MFESTYAFPTSQTESEVPCAVMYKRINKQPVQMIILSEWAPCECTSWSFWVAACLHARDRVKVPPLPDLTQEIHLWE
jgi:hypothetical protein